MRNYHNLKKQFDLKILMNFCVLDLLSSKKGTSGGLVGSALDSEPDIPGSIPDLAKNPSCILMVDGAR